MIHHQYQEFWDDVTTCALACKASASHYRNDQPEYAQLCDDCADLCWICATALKNRGPQFIAAICKACIDVCNACAREGENYASSAARRSVEACRTVIEEYGQIAGMLFLRKKKILQACNRPSVVLGPQSATNRSPQHHSAPEKQGSNLRY